MTRGGKREGAGRKPGPNVTVRVTLPREVWAELEARAEQEGTTPGALLAAAYSQQRASREEEAQREKEVSTRRPQPKKRLAPEHLRRGYVPPVSLPTLEPMKPVTGKAAELLELLKDDGAVMVKVGNRYAVERDGAVGQSFTGATGGALLTRPGLLISAGPDRWTLTPQPLT